MDLSRLSNTVVPWRQFHLQLTSLTIYYFSHFIFGIAVYKALGFQALVLCFCYNGTYLYVLCISTLKYFICIFKKGTILDNYDDFFSQYLWVGYQSFEPGLRILTMTFSVLCVQKYCFSIILLITYLLGVVILLGYMNCQHCFSMFLE